MKITKTSPFSGKVRTREIDATPEQMESWKKGKLIQHVFPHLSASDREFIKTGISDDEWPKEGYIARPFTRDISKLDSVAKTIYDMTVNKGQIDEAPAIDTVALASDASIKKPDEFDPKKAMGPKGAKFLTHADRAKNGQIDEAPAVDTAATTTDADINTNADLGGKKPVGPRRNPSILKFLRHADRAKNGQVDEGKVSDAGLKDKETLSDADFKKKWGTGKDKVEPQPVTNASARRQEALKKYAKEETIQEDEDTLHPQTSWWKNHPDRLMSQVYWHKRQLPPSDAAKKHKNYQNIVSQLQKRHPAPEAEHQKHMNHYAPKEETVVEATVVRSFSSEGDAQKFRKTLGAGFFTRQEGSSWHVLKKGANEEVELDEAKKGVSWNSPEVQAKAAKFKKEQRMFNSAKREINRVKRKENAKNEEVELDELNKSTLSSYIKKAHVSGLQAAATGETAYMQGRINAAAKGKSDIPAAQKKIINSTNKTGEKREAGISRAVDKLSREETIIEDSINFKPIDHTKDSEASEFAKNHGAGAKQLKVYSVHNNDKHIGYAAESTKDITQQKSMISASRQKQAETSSVSSASYSPKGHPTEKVHSSNLEGLKSSIKEYHAAPPRWMKDKVSATEEAITEAPTTPIDVQANKSLKKQGPGHYIQSQPKGYTVKKAPKGSSQQGAGSQFPLHGDLRINKGGQNTLGGGEAVDHYAAFISKQKAAGVFDKK